MLVPLSGAATKLTLRYCYLCFANRVQQQPPAPPTTPLSSTSPGPTPTCRSATFPTARAVLLKAGRCGQLGVGLLPSLHRALHVPATAALQTMCSSHRATLKHSFTPTPPKYPSFLLLLINPRLCNFLTFDPVSCRNTSTPHPPAALPRSAP